MIAEICPRIAVTPGDIASMFQLFESYFSGTSRAIFEEDLANKQDVILLRDAEGRMQGFSTLSVLPYEDHGEKGRAIFSGDTIIRHSHWGTQALPLAFASYAAARKAERPQQPLYWFLISKGHRTYRYLPLLFHDYYPRHDAVTPPHMQRLMDLLATRKFGSCYKACSGLVQFPASRGQLRADWATVPPAALRKPEVRYFLERNPGFAQGDELVCLAELTAGNLRSVGRRRFEETLG